MCGGFLTTAKAGFFFSPNYLCLTADFSHLEIFSMTPARASCCCAQVDETIGRGTAGPGEQRAALR